MKYKINNYVSIIMLMIVSLTFTSCLIEDEEEFGEDSSKVVPEIFDFNGPAVGFVEGISTYSVTPRAGSEFVWTVTGGAEMQPIAGRTDAVNLLFNQIGDASISVYEKTANGLSSDTTILDIDVFGKPCNWTLFTRDTYGDGWNGGYIRVITQGITTDYSQAAGASTGTPVESVREIPISNEAEFSIEYVSGGGTGSGPGWESENYYKLTAPDGTFWESGTFDYSGIPTEEVIINGTNICP